MEPAYEKQPVEAAVPLMFCKHCLRYSMGWCPIHQRERSPYKEPYYLVGTDGKKFRLSLIVKLPDESECRTMRTFYHRVMRCVMEPDMKRLWGVWCHSVVCLLLFTACHYPRPDLQKRRDERSGEGFVNLSCRAALYL